MRFLVGSTEGGYGYPPEEYSDVVSFSPSRAKTFFQSPYHYYWSYILGNFNVTPAMKTGTMDHAYLLDPEEFNKNYVLASSLTYVMNTVADMRNHPATIDAPKSATKAKLKEMILAVDPSAPFYEDIKKDKEIVSVIEEEKLKHIKESLYSSPVIKSCMEKSRKEVPIWWVDSETGIIIRGRIDGLMEGKDPIVWDLKKVPKADPKKFEYDIRSSGNHIQGAMYLNGMTQITGRLHEKFTFICYERTGPYIAAVNSPDIGTISAGQTEARNVLLDFKECTLKDTFPRPEYSNKVNLVALKQWDFEEIEEREND